VPSVEPVSTTIISSANGRALASAAASERSALRTIMQSDSVGGAFAVDFETTVKGFDSLLW
jgi:hypothetical protein